MVLLVRLQHPAKSTYMSSETITDNSPMPFGKYVGSPMVDVPAVYLLWLHNEGCSHQGVKQYILNNLDALNKEAANIKR